jgi:integrase
MVRQRPTSRKGLKADAGEQDVVYAGTDFVEKGSRYKRAIPTFVEAMEETYTASRGKWSAITANVFKASLKRHAVPRLGSLQVDAIGSAEVVEALAPIWTDRTVTARKVCHQILRVLSFSQARGWREQDPPDPAALFSQFTAQPEIKSISAMHFADVPNFFAGELAKMPTPGRIALLFALLTAARPGEVRSSAWEQVNMPNATWTRSSRRAMHTVRLSRAALTLLDRWQPDVSLRKGLIFPGAGGKQLSNMTLVMALRSAHQDEVMAGRAGYLDPKTARVVKVDGFRSSFSQWAMEHVQNLPELALEMALGNKVWTATWETYQRADLRGIRDETMERWGQFVAPSLSGT